MLSGAVLDPSALRDLVPDYKERGAPHCLGSARRARVLSDPRREARISRSPRPRFAITATHIISLSRFVKWLGGLVEAEGIDVFTGFPAVEVLYDGDRVVGVRTGDRGIGRHGEVKSNFEPGVDVRAKVTILTDGVRGNLTKALVRQARARRRASAATVRARHQGAVGDSQGSPCAWHGHPHDGLSAEDGGVRRRVHLCHARRTRVAGIRERARLSSIRCSIRT